MYRQLVSTVLTLVLLVSGCNSISVPEANASAEAHQANVFAEVGDPNPLTEEAAGDAVAEVFGELTVEAVEALVFVRLL